MKPQRFTEDQIRKVARYLLEVAPGKIWAIHGDMGAGKTTLINALVKELGSEDRTGSPTFGLVNEYVDPKGQPLAYHFDFYRLNSPEEVLDIGFEEYLHSNAWIFMEWPERVISYLPEYRWDLKIELVDERTRIIREAGITTE